MSTGSQSPCEDNWDAERVLDFYIHDYMLRKNYASSAGTFLLEGQVLTMVAPTMNDAEDGFLLEWWSLFTDVYFPHMSRKVRKLEESHTAASLAPQLSEPHRQVLEKNPASAAHHQTGTHASDLVRYLGIRNCTSPGYSEADAGLRNQATAHATASLMLEEELKLARERDIDTYMKRPVQCDARGPPRPSQSLPRNNILGHLHQSSRVSSQSFDMDLGATPIKKENSTSDDLLCQHYLSLNVGNNPQFYSRHGTDSSMPQNLPSQQISCVRALRHHQLADPPHQQLVLKAQVGTKSSGAAFLEDVGRENDGFSLLKGNLTSPDRQSKDVPRCTNKVECPLSKGTGEKDMTMKMKQLARLHGQPKSSLLRQNSKQRKAIQLQESKRETSAMNSSAADPHGIPTPTVVDLENPSTCLSYSVMRDLEQPETLLPVENVKSTEGMNTGGQLPFSGGIRTQFPALQPSSSTLGVSNTVEKFHQPDSPAMESPLDWWSRLLCGASGALELEYDMEQFWSNEGAYQTGTGFAQEADPDGNFGELDSKEHVEHTLNADFSSLIEVGCPQPSSSSVACCDFSVDGNLLAAGGDDRKVPLTNKGKKT